jgi:transcriptional regulator with XRE-family HTH domain
MKIRIKEIRERKGITQEEFAKKIGASQSKANHIENGNRRIKIDEAEKIAKALESTVTEVFFDETSSDIISFPKLQKERLLQIIETVETFLNKKGVNLPIDKKAKLIATLIEKASRENLQEADIINFSSNYADVEAV